MPVRENSRRTGSSRNSIRKHLRSGIVEPPFQLPLAADQAGSVLGQAFGEMAFSRLKTLIRKAAARNYDQLWQTVGYVCNLFSDEECYNFFKAAGYEADWVQHALAGT